MDIKQAILNWILNQNKDYNYINKRFQDTVMNYFMEDYIAPLLMQDYNLQVYREIHVILKNKLKQDKDRVLPKYMGILNIYANELRDKNRYNEYNRKLCTIIQEETAHSSSNYNSQMWKKLVAFLLLEHSVNNSIKNFNGMWQSAFPDRPLKKIKMPKNSKNNTSYYKKRMQVLKQKEMEFDFNLNTKNNQLILNMLINNSSISSPESKLNSPLICEISNKPQYFNVQQLQTKQITTPLRQNSPSQVTSSQSSFQTSHSSQSYSSSTNCVNEKNSQQNSIANDKVQIKQEDTQESLDRNKRSFSSNELDEENEEEQEYQNYPSENTSRMAKIEEGQYENEYEYLYQQQQNNQQYATSSQLTISHYDLHQKLPIQQQKFDLRQQQQNQIYYCVNNSTLNSNNYNNKNHQNLYNTLNNFNNNNINNINYYNYQEKLHNNLQYSDETNNDMLNQEPHAMANHDFNESVEPRQIEDAFYCDEDQPKQYQTISLLGYQTNYLPANNFICNNDYSDFQ